MGKKSRVFKTTAVGEGYRVKKKKKRGKKWGVGGGKPLSTTR